eukprot:TRINITY_DN2832_c1_g1_i1.p1 TRINITY_DN2832_c1_g1~~TRINITY_DN2832_c1_g1_i1.p1  ORF type:complete len:555 (+),score=128.45 TRINITY_DN2832_c1_g1_i1:162-1826(+)
MTETAASKKWEEVQKKAFTHWVNTQLAKREASITELETGFITGVNLITLVEVLSGQKIPIKFTKAPKLKVHKINNCFIALKFLQDDLMVKSITISAEDIVNGDRLTLLLGFCWLMLRTFQEPAPVGGGEKASSFEANLLQWVKDTLVDYKDIDLTDGFKSASWSNGKALLALVDVFDSDILKGSYSSIDCNNKLPNCELALNLAEQHVKLPNGLIDPTELAEGICSEKNLVLYLSLFYNSFKEKSASNTKESLEKRLKDLEEKVRFYEEENAQLRSLQSNLKLQEKNLSTSFTEITEVKSSLKTAKEEIECQLGELSETFGKEKSLWQSKVTELNEEIKVLKSSADSSTTNLQNEKDELAKDRDSLKEELKATKDKLNKEKEEIASRNEELSSNLKKVNRMREELEEIMKQQEQNQERTLNALRKHLLRHVRDMQIWKGYLERDREYQVEEDPLPDEEELSKKKFANQVTELDITLLVENKRLEKLIREREIEAAEVVSVNIGKKKKRIKKDDPLIDKIDLNKVKKNQAGGAAPKSARGQFSARPNVAKKFKKT